MKKDFFGKKLQGQIEQLPDERVVRRSYVFEGSLGILLLGFGVLAFYAKQEPYFPIDLELTQAIQAIHYVGFDQLMQFISLIGNPEWALLLMIGISVILISQKLYRQVFFFVLSVGGMQFVSYFFKYLISRPRPDPELIRQTGMHFYSDSFPSGHVTFFVACFGFLFFLTYSQMKNSLVRNILLVLLGLLVGLIGVSRIYLGAHWFSDTLGAYIIGAVWLMVMIHLFARSVKHNK